MEAATDYETGKDIILKEWNGFGFKFIEKQDHSKVLAQMEQNFYIDEPISQFTGLSPERKLELDERLTNIMTLNHGSFYAYPLGHPDKVACVLLIWFQEKEKPSSSNAPKARRLFPLVEQLHARYDIHKELGLEFFPELLIISTDKQYRGKGIATEMYCKAIEKFKAQGLPLVASSFTNPLSRKIGEKLGFKTVAKVDFTEAVKPDGTSMFGDEAKGNFVVAAVLHLK